MKKIIVSVSDKFIFLCKMQGVHTKVAIESMVSKYVREREIVINEVKKEKEKGADELINKATTG